MMSAASLPRSASVTSVETARRILELGRWAPSGDNTQPWRFAIVSPTQIVVHAHDTHADCVYDLDGVASQLAHGMLLETIAIAATTFGLRMQLREAIEGPAGRCDYRLELIEDWKGAPDPLADVITLRAVQRRAMPPRKLSGEDKRALEHSAAPYSIRWLESWPRRLEAASLNARNAHIRMTIPEAFAVHKKIIAFGTRTSEDRVPDAALGASAALLAVMRFAFESWERMQRINRYLGTWMPRLQLDLVPGILCSAHAAFATKTALVDRTQRLAAGRAVQRFWLTATQLGLQMQPSYTPLLFARYAREGRTFSRMTHAMPAAQNIRGELLRVLGADADSVFWFARIGPARRVRGRSLRLPIERLILDPSDPANHASSASTPSS